MRILITGSDGLIGGAAVEYFDALGHEVYGADNNMRKVFFGEQGSTEWNRHRIFHKCKNYHPNDTDITNKEQVWSLFHRGDDNPTVFEYDVIIHCAAQPSHDYANQHPEIDYNVNVLGTYNLLDCALKYSPNAVFIFMSTNKVYDDYVNEQRYTEFETRYSRDPFFNGFDESTPVGASNVFGSHKLMADQMVQDFAKKGLKTMVLRGGCLTGSGHSGVPLHGFLNYLIRCVATEPVYTVYGHKGKQVRDNIHSYDVVKAFDEMIKNPKPGEVYNIGGGMDNSISVIEAIRKAEVILGKKVTLDFKPERSNDHKCYVTDMTKFKRDYPNWGVTKNLDDIFKEITDQLYWGVETEHKETITYPELNEDSLVFDVGGCRGRWSQSIIEKYNPRIWVFEPVYEFYLDCRHRFKSNSKIDCFNFGLSNMTHEIMISKQGVNSSAYRGNEWQEQLPIDPMFGAAKPEMIKLVDISTFLINNHVDEVDLMSINCEGGEYDILLRLIETGQIKMFKNIQVQFHDFYPDAVSLRDMIREKLKETHTERFCYPFVWESWRRI